MKSITSFIGSLGGGGAQGVFVTVMNYYIKLGYDVKVVVDDLENDVHSSKLDKRIEIIELGAKSAKKSLPKTYNYLRHNQIEVAFAFSPEIAINLYFCKKILHQNFIILARCINTLSYEYKYADEPFRRFVTGRLVKRYYRKIDHVVAQSENMKKDLIDNYGFRTTQVTTINNPLAAKYENREKVRKNKGEYILYVGRFEKQKGLEMLITAFANIKRKDIELYLVGKGSRRNELEYLSKELKVSDRIKFIDFTTDIDYYYENAICTALTSLFEGFPNVLTESIACGTPVVAYNLPSGPEDIILNGTNGYLVKYLDVDDMTRCLDMAIDKKWNYEQIQMSANRFSKENILPKYQELIQPFLE